MMVWCNNNRILSILTRCFFLQSLLLATRIQSTNGGASLRRTRQLESNDDNPVCDYSNEYISNMVEEVKHILLQKGYTFREGKLQTFQKAAQEDQVSTATFGSNPGTKYFAYYLNTYDETNPSLRIKASSAVLFLGCTPSAAKYFSWRSYAWRHKQKTVFASLGDSINNLVINTTASALEDSSGKLTAVVTTADGTMLSNITTILEEAGAPNGIVNVDAIPSNRVDLFKDPSLNFMLIHRANVWTNRKREKEYFNQVRPVLLIDPPAASSSSSGQEFVDPFLPEVPLRVQGNGESEAEQRGVQRDLSKLRETIIASMESASYKLISRTKMTDKDYDGFECLETRTNCKGDNRDTNYIYSRSNKPFKKTDLYVIVGTNAIATRKCTYTSFGMYQVEPVTNSTSVKLITTNITADDIDMDHSASAFGIDNDKVMAFTLSRNCKKISNKSMREYCVQVGYDPQREIPSKTAFSLSYRAYLDPETKTSPLVSELVLPQILKFQPV